MQISGNRVVAGFGRSGTTWIQDAVAQANSLRAVFEPLHPDVGPEADSYAHSYIEAADSEPALKAFLHRYFHDEYSSLWADYRVRADLISPQMTDLVSWAKLKKKTRRGVEAWKNFLRFNRQRRFPGRIIKLIHANMMLSWLKDNFQAKIVFVIRHPAPVVMSQMRSPEIWRAGDRISRYRSDAKLLSKLSGAVNQLLDEDLNEVEALTLSWCIENSVALQHCEENDIEVVYYERLIEEGEAGWQRIIDTFDLPNRPCRDLISQPSQQAWGARRIDTEAVARYASWMSQIEPGIGRRIQTTLDTCDFRRYAMGDALPNLSADLGSTVNNSND